MLTTAYTLNRQTDRQTDKHNCALFARQYNKCTCKPSERIGGFAVMPFGWFFALIDKDFQKAREPCLVPYRQLE